MSKRASVEMIKTKELRAMHLPARILIRCRACIALRDLVSDESRGTRRVKLTNAHETNHKKERVSIVRTCHYSRAHFKRREIKGPGF